MNWIIKGEIAPRKKQLIIHLARIIDEGISDIVESIQDPSYPNLMCRSGVLRCGNNHHSFLETCQYTTDEIVEYYKKRANERVDNKGTNTKAA